MIASAVVAEATPDVPPTDRETLPAILTLVPREERVAAMTGTIEAAIERLAGQLAQGYSVEFQQMLSFFGRFHRYSWKNTVLISIQCPHASLVAGMRRWNSLGYTVRRGERALWILAPVLRKELDAVTGQEVEVVSGFRPASVFDASQLADLDEKPLPSLERRLPDDAEDLYQMVRARVEGHGIGVEERHLPAGVEGASLGGRIVIRPGLDSRSRLLVLLHEVTHEVEHAGATGDVKPRHLRELEAEATAFTVAAVMGIESPFASDYLVGYQVTAEDLKASLATVARLVRTVLAIVAPDETEVVPLAA